VSTRRVVTGHDAQGRSVVLEDGPVPVDQRHPDAEFHEIWSTGPTPVTLSANEPDPTAGPVFIPPVRGGTRMRIVVQMPNNRSILHRTETVDYAIVLTGEIVAVLDDDHEVTLSAGDVLIQRGTTHAWINRGDTPCAIAFVLVDAEFDDDLLSTLPEGARHACMPRPHGRNG